VKTLWYLLRVVRATALPFAGEVASGLAYFGLPLVLGLATQAFFDGLTGRAPAGLNLWTALALLVCLELVRSGTLVGLDVTTINLRYAGSGLLRANLLDQLLRRPGALPLPDSPGEAISRFRDDAESVMYNAIDCWCDLIGRTIFALAAFAVMARIDLPLTLAVIAMMSLAVPFAILAGERTTTYGRLNREAIAKVTGFLGEIFGGVQAVKAGGAVGPVVAHLQALGERRRQAAVRDQVWEAVVTTVDTSVVTVGIGLVLLIAGQAIRSGSFTVGDFSLFVVYLTDLMWFPEEIARWFVSYRLAGVAFGRMAHLLGDRDPRSLVEPSPATMRRSAGTSLPRKDAAFALVPAVTALDQGGGRSASLSLWERARVRVVPVRRNTGDILKEPDRDPHPSPLPLGEGAEGSPTDPFDTETLVGGPSVSHDQAITGRAIPRERLGVVGRTPLLVARGLTYRHPSSDRGIHEVSLTVEPGSFVAITGRVAAGKTTFLEVLLGLLPRNAGEIIWKGSIVVDPTTFFGPPRSSYVPQIPRLFSETLRENVAEGWDVDEAFLSRVAQLAVLDPDLAAFPDGWNTLVGTRGARLSGGQIHRVAAARAFVRTPELLVLDDLSSALDVPTEELLWEQLAEWRRASPELTILAVSHRPTALKRADRIFKMEEGRIVDGEKE
jgi:ATP-binding cassette subfamily B protein